VTGRLDGRVAVVTGGASGLGAAIVERFQSDGAQVEVADLDAPNPVDVTRETEVAAFFGGVADRHGRLDALVCSAAVEIRAPLLETSDDDWQRVLDVNLKGPFLCLKHGIPQIVATGGGSCVLMGSTLGAIGSPNYAAYCASKGALVNLAKQAAIEHAPDQVRVNVVSPTACEAGLFLKMAEASGDPEGIKRFVAERTPMGRLGAVDDVTQTVVYLVTDASAYVSGAVVPLDGGLAARRMP
jgi:NAD(P)-dependent dehydrogenase (short-subunit alcohol dehydrogenase family)